MQHFMTRNGQSQWISDGEPSAEAIDAALLVEFASRYGMDWTEANEDLYSEATDDAERAAANARAEAMTDERLVHCLGLMIAERRRAMLKSRAKLAVWKFITGLFVQVPA